MLATNVSTSKVNKKRMTNYCRKHVACIASMKISQITQKSQKGYKAEECFPHQATIKDEIKRPYIEFLTFVNFIYLFLT